MIQCVTKQINSCYNFKKGLWLQGSYIRNKTSKYFHFFFFSFSNLFVKSSKSMSSPPADDVPTELPGSGNVLLGTVGRSGKLKPTLGGGPLGALWTCFFGSSPNQSSYDALGGTAPGSTKPPGPIGPDWGTGGGNPPGWFCWNKVNCI